VRGKESHHADDVLVKTFSDGVVKREHTFKRDPDTPSVMVVRDKHNGDVRRIAVPSNALTLLQLPHYIESPEFSGAAGSTVTLLETEGGIATWRLNRRGTATINLHGRRIEAAVIDGEGDPVDGHERATFYLVNGRIELISYGERPLFVLRASRGGARQNLGKHPLYR